MAKIKSKTATKKDASPKKTMKAKVATTEPVVAQKVAKAVIPAKEATVVDSNAQHSLKTTLGPKKDGVTIGDCVLEVPEEAITNALVALRKSIATEDDEDVTLQRVALNFQMATIPETPYQKHVLIPVPHSIFSLSDTDICVFVPDGHKAEYEANTDLTEGVDKIIEFSELFKEYQSFDAKKELVNNFDLFLCDRRLSPNVGNFLGRAFRDKGKQPVLLNLGYDGSNIGALVQSVEMVRNAVKFQCRTGPLISLTLGRSDQTNEELTANSVAIFQGVNDFFTKDAPEEYRNTVIKCSVTFRDSKAIPLFAHKAIYH